METYNQRIKACAVVAFLALASITHAETRSIVPRASGEGGIGTASKPWGTGVFVKVKADEYDGIPPQPIKFINGSTSEYQEIVSGSGIICTNLTEGGTNRIYIAVGSSQPFPVTNLAGFTRMAWGQIAANLGGATDILYSVTNSSGLDVYAQLFGASGGSPVANSYSGHGMRTTVSFFATNNSIIRLQVGQGGARYCTNGLANNGVTNGFWRAYPDGRVSTNYSTSNGGGGGSSKIYLNEVLVGTAAGGGAGPSIVAHGGSAGKTAASGSGTGAGTGATQSGSGVFDGDGPGSGGGGPNGGSGQSNGSAGGGGAGYINTEIAIGDMVPQTGSGGSNVNSPAFDDADWVTPVGLAATGTAGNNGLIVIYVRPRQ